MLISRLMLWSPWRQYVIEKIKKPLLDTIVRLATRYPPPMRDTVEHPNTFILLDIRDKFFEHEDNPDRDALFQAIWRIFIVEYEHDPYYRWRIDWVLDEIRKSDWQPKTLEPRECLRNRKLGVTRWKP